MPIYAYKCDECLNEADHFRRVDERDNAPECCGKSTRRLMSAPMIGISAKPFQSYKCPVTDQIVDSERQRRNIMAEHRLVDANDCTPDYVIKKKKAQTAENQRLAAELTKDIPKELLPTISSVAAEAA